MNLSVSSLRELLDRERAKTADKDSTGGSGEENGRAPTGATSGGTGPNRNRRFQSSMVGMTSPTRNKENPGTRDPTRNRTRSHHLYPRYPDRSPGLRTFASPSPTKLFDVGQCPDVLIRGGNGPSSKPC